MLMPPPITARVFASLAFALVFSVLALAQTAENVTIRVTIIDKSLNPKNVPKFALVVKKPDDAAFAEQKIATSFEGTAALNLPPGEYTIVSEKPLDFEERSFAWEHKFRVEAGRPATVELSNDNARITAAAPPQNVAGGPRRRVSEEGEMFKTLRDGVVSIEGELGTGTGFIIDPRGIILTNQHVVSKANEIRVRFDRQTAVRARLLAEDAERDIAVLQVNLEVCPSCRVLKIASNSPGEPAVVEGERVFTIGSPLFQDKILTSGIVSKVEPRAIISDVAVNPGNSGGPLFNSVGEVIGLTTFGIQAEGGPGISGIVRIEEAAELVAKAREKAAGLSPMAVERMPNMPEGSFPVEAIKTRIDVKKFEQKPYKADIKDYQINYMTPVYKFFISEKDRLESEKNRKKRNREKGAIDTVDRYRNLRNWNEYAGELRPVVDILALPEVTVTGKSLLLGIVTTAAAGITTPMDYKFKADFYQMKLMCNGEEVSPLKRSKVEFGAQLQNYFKVKTRYTYAGLYSYPFETFEPGKCGTLQLHVFSEEDIEKPIVTVITEATKNRIWTDFTEYREQSAQK